MAKSGPRGRRKGTDCIWEARGGEACPGIHGVVAGEWLDPASEPAKAKRGVLLDSDGAAGSACKSLYPS